MSDSFLVICTSFGADWLFCMTTALGRLGPLIVFSRVLDLLRQVYEQMFLCVQLQREVGQIPKSWSLGHLPITIEFRAVAFAEERLVLGDSNLAPLWVQTDDSATIRFPRRITKKPWCRKSAYTPSEVN